MLEIKPIPAFNDNYIWLIQQMGNNQAWVVDPGSAEAVENYIQQYQLQLAGILITHHHHDHTGGVAELKQKYSISAYGAAVTNCTDYVLQQEDVVDILGCQFKAISVPGHTLDHLAFYNAEQGILFSGDTLFFAGCGRLFEGTAAQMHESLNKLAKLPDETLVYCTHEYTEANLQFAVAVEPDNPHVLQAIQRVAKLRAEGQPSLPTTIGAEKCHNPFFRSQQPALIGAATERAGSLVIDPTDVFATIRQWKDNF